MYLSKFISVFDLDENKSLLINALSGALDIVDDSELGIINRIKEQSYTSDSSDEDFIKAMKERGHLFESKENEDKEIQRLLYIYNDALKNNILNFVICPTMSCNLRCTYCFESIELRGDNKVMTTEQVHNIFKHIDTITKLRKSDRKCLELFGGEPLLRSTFEVNKEIFRNAKERGIKITIITNGTHIACYMNLLKEYRDILESLQITVDGVREIHDKRRIRVDKGGTFDIISKGIDALLEECINVKVRVNVDRENIDGITDIQDYFNEKGWNTKNFFTDIAPVTDYMASQRYDNIMPEHEIVEKIQKLFPNHNNSNFNLKMFRVLNHVNNALRLTNNSQESFPNFNYCEANHLQYYVFSPDGNIYACPESVGNPISIVGKYGEELSLDYESLEKWDNRNIFSIPKCRECKIAPFCGGGCAYGALTANGDINCPVCADADKVLSHHIGNVKEYILQKYS